MAKSKNYTYDFTNIQEGEVFKNFTELFKTVTGKKPPTGAKNRQAVENVLHQYIDYCKASEANSDIKPSRALIVTKVYDTPRTVKENRGSHGEYADYLRPLLLTSCDKSFSGKMSTLANNLGIFKKYTTRQFCHLQDGNAHIDWSEFNPWATQEYTSAGVQRYKRYLWNQIRDKIKSSLDSLQNAGILQWNYYHQLIPSILVAVEETHQKRPKSREELWNDEKKRAELWNEVGHDTNSVLLPETLYQLNIHSSMWPNNVSYESYRDSIYTNSPNSPYEFPLRATKEQEAAIENLNAFMRQYAYKKLYKMKTLPSTEEVEVSDTYRFFTNPQLSKTYMALVKETYPWLIECKAIWKEVEYNICENSERAPHYIDLQSFDKEDYQNILSRKFIEYMDSHMDRTYFTPNNASELKEHQIGHIGTVLCNYSLNHSIQACELHESLKALYNI